MNQENRKSTSRVKYKKEEYQTPLVVIRGGHATLAQEARESQPYYEILGP
jgi:hypothetical protein